MIRIGLFVGRLLILLVVGVFVSACGSAQSTSSQAPSSRPPSNPLIIGAPLAISGAHSVEGNLTKNGYDLWADEVNKAGGIRIGRQRRMVQIKYYDDESDAQKSAQFAERLILEENVGLLLWPYGTVATDQVAEIAERNGAAESIFNHGYEYTFGVVSPAKQFAAAMIDLAVHQNPRPESIAIVFANDPFSLGVAEGAKAFAESLGVTVSVYERYQPNTSELSGVVTLAKITGAEMLLNAGQLVHSLAIIKAAKDLDYNPKLFGFTVGPATPDFIEVLGEDAEYVVTSSQWSETVGYKGVDLFGTPERYAELYREKFDSSPDYHAASGTAAAVSLQAAIENAGSLDPQEIRNALASLDIITFYGPMVGSGLIIVVLTSTNRWWFNKFRMANL